MNTAVRTVGAALRGRPCVESKRRGGHRGPPLQYVRSCLKLLILTLAIARSASAHEGPPFPLFVDQKVDRYVVSVWTDPDVGTALFFVIVNAPDLPPDLHVQIGVQPVSGRLAEVFYPAERENVPQELRVWLRYRSEKYFGEGRTSPGARRRR